MELSFLKLDAKRKLVKNHFKLFLASVIPYVAIFSLAAANYYLYFLLKQTDFSFIPNALSYADIIRPLLLTASAVLSFFLWRTARLCGDRYFFVKSRSEKASLATAFRGLGLRRCFTFLMTDLLRFFLSLAWSALYYFPALITAGILYYAYKNSYDNKIMLTLFVSLLMLSAVGTVFLYVTLKRYSMCSSVIFSEKCDSLRAVEKSIEIMEGNTVKYALYSLSFWGWTALCVLIIPLIYVLPYKNMARFSFYNSVSGFMPKAKEKPIIFYFPQKEHKKGLRPEKIKP